MSGVKIVSNDSQTVTIDDLIFNVTYEIFAVSVGGDLPSEHSNAVTATTGKGNQYCIHYTTVLIFGNLFYTFKKDY